MSIEKDLRTRLTAAMKARDARTANVIRMLNTKVTERRTAKGFKGEVDDALYLEVIAAYAKQMEKARQEYEAAGERGREQVAELQFEIDFCSEFLPKPLGDDELRAAVRQVIAAQGITDPKQAGRVVGGVMKDHKGRVEAGRVKQVAEEELSRQG
jgi:uncharacterized protein